MLNSVRISQWVTFSLIWWTVSAGCALSPIYLSSEKWRRIMRWQQITRQLHFTYANIFSATWEQSAGLVSISSPFKTQIKETWHHILSFPFSFLSFICFEICTGIRSRFLLTWQCLPDFRTSFAFLVVCLFSSPSHFHWRTHYNACGVVNYLGIFWSLAAAFLDCQWPGCSSPSAQLHCILEAVILRELFFLCEDYSD